MKITPSRRRRWGWNVAAEARRRNPVGDWALRTGIAAFAVPLLLTLVGAMLFDEYGTILLVWVALILTGVLSLAALLLGIAGLAVAEHGNLNTRSAWWGVSIGALFLSLGLLAAIGS